MDWETTWTWEQMCQDLDRSYFSSQFNQSRHFPGKGQNEIEPEYEKSKVETEESSMMMRDIVAAGRAAVRSSSAASSAAQEASKAAATAAENAKAALEEVEELVKILEGHKCHQRTNLPTTNMSSQKNINSSTHFDSSTKTFVNKSKYKTVLDISSDPNKCDQKAKESGTKDAVGLKSWSQVFKQMFTRKETIVDGIEDSLSIYPTALEGSDSMDAATDGQRCYVQEHSQRRRPTIKKTTPL